MKPLALALVVLLSAQAAAHPAAPPPQPTSGPGGSDLPFAAITWHRYGDGDSQYWIFEPAHPTPKSAPVVIFLHGWGVMTPSVYGAWIEHIVRRGNIVIFPRYQATLLTHMGDYTPNAVAAVKAAIAELKADDHVRPQLNHVAVVGHSMGGAMTANVAALGGRNGLPPVAAFCCVEPANKSRWAQYFQMPMEDLRKISADTLALVIVGDRDITAGEDTARYIFWSIKQIPEAKKDFVTLISDTHGNPPLIASHFAPVAVAGIVSDGNLNSSGRHFGWNSLNALDFYGTWKLFDGLTDAAFFGKHAEYALGDTPQQRYMGKWSDGTPVKELKVTEHP
jgi:acetyl esterase/lipase